MLAVGEKGVEALSELNKQGLLAGKGAYIAASTHQYSEHIKDLPLDYIALPHSSITFAQKEIIKSKGSHTFTTAVPTKNPTIEELESSYSNWDCENKPSLEGSYMVVMLPEDAQEPNGKMKLFTEQSASQLFEAVYGLWQKHKNTHKIILQNGPRTGKYLADGSVQCTHEYIKAEDSSAAIDPVSKKFVAWLDLKSVPHSFFNFAFEISDCKRHPISVYNQWVCTR